jgi:hypothetical protein
MLPKPAHLGPVYGAQFQDRSVADAYAARPPYPPEFFDIVESLLPPAGSEPRRILELGCGTGDNVIGGKIAFSDGRFNVAYSPTGVTLSNFQAVPEPGGIAGIALAMMAGIRRRRRV